jgi:hypothetical protein
MKLTKLSAAPTLAPQAALRPEVPPHARAGPFLTRAPLRSLSAVFDRRAEGAGNGQAELAGYINGYYSQRSLRCVSSSSAVLGRLGQAGLASQDRWLGQTD